MSFLQVFFLSVQKVLTLYIPRLVLSRQREHLYSKLTSFSFQGEYPSEDFEKEVQSEQDEISRWMRIKYCWFSS